MFDCDKCGLCCMSIGHSELYMDLNRGDGVCRYLDETTKLCTIYDERPLKCNIDKMYEECFASMCSKKKYYELNYEVCRLLKRSGEKCS